MSDFVLPHEPEILGEWYISVAYNGRLQQPTGRANRGPRPSPKMYLHKRTAAVFGKAVKVALVVIPEDE